VFSRKLSISSKKQLIIILLIFVIPLISFFITYNLITVNTINDRIAQSNKSTIIIYQEAIINEVDNITKFMIDLTAINPDFQQLRNKRSNLDAYLNAYDVRESYRTIINIHPMIGGFYIYSDANQLFQSSYNEGLSYKEKYTAEEFVKNELKDEKTCDTREWFAKQIADKYFLFRILGNKGTYTICFIKLNDIKSIKDFNKNSEGFILLSTDEGVPLTSTGKIEKEGIHLKGKSEDYYISGEENKYIIVQNPLEDLAVNIVYIVPHHGIIYYMDRSQELLIFASVLIVLLIPVCYYMLQHSYFRPLAQLVKTMNSIKNGKLDTKMKDNYGIIEFKQFSDTFNEMMEQIQYFKISAYEKEIESQRAQLQYLQIQIRPHFFLNCLKNIYAMAQEDKRKEIQEMILALSMNYRYMFRDSFERVPLSLEIENVINYINIQKMNRSYEIICNTDIAPEVKSFEVPPISVLTFVENSVKHGPYLDKPMNIYIKARLLSSEEGEYVNITISDNGKGFSEEDLIKLNGKEDADSGEHIGITNVKNRFSIIYSGKSTISFSNQANGACVEIFIPFSL
jgi:two-component system, sensor histidine kinase YesM